MKLFRKTIFYFLILTLTSVQSAPVYAALVDTDALLGSADRNLTVNQVIGLLERTTIQRELTAMGVDPDMARDRIAQLTDEELQQLASIDGLPAGGSAAGMVLTVFIVLVITDMLGATDVFPFVKNINK